MTNEDRRLMVETLSEMKELKGEMREFKLHVIGRVEKLEKKESALRITLKTFVDLEGVISAAIKFCKPDGKKGEFAAAVLDTANGVIFHEVIEGEIDASGWWAFWAFVTFADGRTVAGEAAKIYVWKEGSG